LGLAFWTYVARDDASLMRYPTRRYEAFREGREALGQVRGTEARVISLVVALEGRRPVRVVRREFLRHELTRQGLISRRHQEGERRAAADIIGDLFEPRAANGKVRSLTRRLAMKRIASEYRWKPSRAVLDALCADMNRRAGRVVLQRINDDLVAY
jgi:hypothetical protein